ncbi:MAG: DUF3422 domain-containing protein [Burkholderiaceae bacterium]
MTDAPQPEGLPPAHPHRQALANEVHARPPEALATPSRVSYVAVLIDPAARAAETAHLVALCAQHGAPLPPAGANHHSAQLGELKLKWERHGEFSGYTFIVPGQSPVPYSEPPTRQLPPGWLQGIPGRTLVAAHGKIVTRPADGVGPEFLGRHFGAEQVIGAEVGGGAGLAFTDFRLHADGFSRFLLIDERFTTRQAGRMMQRLFEIEAYRMMALLALPLAREQLTRVAQIEADLARLTTEMATADGQDEDLLHHVTRLAAEVESCLAASQFRFGACRAYGELVSTRIGELRERHLPGIQTVGEFMARRFTPAVATCTTASQRLHDLSERVAQASGLLSTRVDIARERQNQALLASMDRRAKMQLRLQETVEGLSVAAIVYYAAGLVGYGAKALKSRGLPVDPDLTVGLALPLLVVFVLLSLRRARRRLAAAGA